MLVLYKTWEKQDEIQLTKNNGLLKQGENICNWEMFESF